MDKLKQLIALKRKQVEDVAIENVSLFSLNNNKLKVCNVEINFHFLFLLQFFLFRL